jgi:hypothetical protein
MNQSRKRASVWLLAALVCAGCSTTGTTREHVASAEPMLLDASALE